MLELIYYNILMQVVNLGNHLIYAQNYIIMTLFPKKRTFTKGGSVMAENKGLNDFTIDWNKAHRSFFFTIQWAPVVGRPVNIEMRYTAVCYRGLYTTDDWIHFKTMVGLKSHNLMMVVSSEEAFSQGVVQIVVSSANHDYSESYIVSTLEWIGRDFFGVK